MTTTAAYPAFGVPSAFFASLTLPGGRGPSKNVDSHRSADRLAPAGDQTAEVSAPSRERVGIYPDWIAPPIWLLDDDGREVGNGINLVSGTPLAGRLEDWGLRWDANLDVEGQSKSEAVEAALLDELRELASEIQTQLGPPYLVELRLDA